MLQLKEIYRIQGTYLDYIPVVNNIPFEWRQEVSNYIKDVIYAEQNVYTNPYVTVLLKTTKGTLTFYEQIGFPRNMDTFEKWNNLVHKFNTSLTPNLF